MDEAKGQKLVKQKTLLYITTCFPYVIQGGEVAEREGKVWREVLPKMYHYTT